MANSKLLIIGGIIGVISFILLMINLSVYSSNQSMINKIDQKLDFVFDRKKFDNLRDGDLVYISGEYQHEQGSFDHEFRVKFPETSIIKRKVERYQTSSYSFLRLLGFTENEEKNKSPKELQFLENAKTEVEQNHKQLRCNYFCFFLFN